jgi:ABC-type dipeptide/oligopeptide/nickel transport system ATPase component
MCQRVILALAIANAPRLLMVDKPTSGLDVTISVQILDLLQSSVRRLRSGLIVVSRDLGVVAHYCERVAVMQAGRIVEEAPVRTFFAAPAMPTAGACSRRLRPRATPTSSRKRAVAAERSPRRHHRHPSWSSTGWSSVSRSRAAARSPPSTMSR